MNAVRHAEARRIEIQVDYQATMLRIEVRDDGRGFSPVESEVARRNGHFGLSGMRERATHMKGSCAVSAGPEGGTKMALVLPYI